jgi:hypothetical protein
VAPEDAAPLDDDVRAAPEPQATTDDIDVLLTALPPEIVAAIDAL